MIREVQRSLEKHGHTLDSPVSLAGRQRDSLLPPIVDFPSSPTALRYLADPGEDCGGVRLAEREDTTQPPATPTEEEQSLYTAVVSPPTGQVTLRKGEWRASPTEPAGRWDDSS